MIQLHETREPGIQLRKTVDLMDEFYKPAVAECQQYIRKCQAVGQTPSKGDFLVMNEKPDGHVPKSHNFDL